MEFYFKTVDLTVHLYRVKGFFDEDLGELKTTFNGKLTTSHIFAENFELKDISGVFSKGIKYSIKSTKGLEGIIEKKGFSDKYVFKQM